MSREENNPSAVGQEQNKNAAGQSNPKAHTNDPGSFSQRGEHVNKEPNESAGGLKNDREPENEADETKKGDSTQAGTQNSSSVSRDSGRTLTEKSQDQRSGKFGPEHNSNTTGF